MATETLPKWMVQHWFNTPRPISLERLRGRVVVLEAFQMLCPGCVSQGLPQASRVYETFSRDDVAVIGLHAVFEHHQAQTPVAIEAFLHEYRIQFPVGVDTAGEGQGIPQTMAAYQMEGTPTLVLIDRQGHRRAQYFGHVPDLRLGAEIKALIDESAKMSIESASMPDQAPVKNCDGGVCRATEWA